MKRTTIESADTAPTALLARKRLRHSKSLRSVSTVGWKDHQKAFYISDTLKDDIFVVHKLTFQRLDRKHQWQSTTGVCYRNEPLTVNR